MLQSGALKDPNSDSFRDAGWQRLGRRGRPVYRQPSIFQNFHAVYKNYPFITRS
jgi:hypothetical protein